MMINMVPWDIDDNMYHGKFPTGKDIYSKEYMSSFPHPHDSNPLGEEPLDDYFDENKKVSKQDREIKKLKESVKEAAIMQKAAIKKVKELVREVERLATKEVDQYNTIELLTIELKKQQKELVEAYKRISDLNEFSRADVLDLE